MATEVEVCHLSAGCRKSQKSMCENLKKFGKNAVVDLDFKVNSSDHIRLIMTKHSRKGSPLVLAGYLLDL